MRFLQTPPPKSASNLPASISLAAMHSAVSASIFFDHRPNVLVLYIRLLDMIIAP